MKENLRAISPVNMLPYKKWMFFVLKYHTTFRPGEVSEESIRIQIVEVWNTCLIKKKVSTSSHHMVIPSVNQRVKDVTHNGDYSIIAHDQELCHGRSTRFEMA